MSSKIFYYQYEGARDPITMLDSPLDIEGVGLEPRKEIDNHSPKDTPFYDCPAWSHRAKREFVIYAPRDITLYVNNETGELQAPNISQEDFERWVNVQDAQLPITTIQIPVPMFLFWTESKNIWIEQIDHPRTASHNNFTLVTGWFNLSSWCRPISLGVRLVDDKKPIIIKRGDPLYKIRFMKEGNFNKTFELVKSRPEPEVMLDVHKRVKAKKIIPYLSDKLIFGCPFK